MEFQTIFNEYRPKIFRYLVRLVGLGEADDLTQEVFLKASQGLAGFRAEAKVSTWLYRIATNAAVDLRRRQGRTPGQEAVADLEGRATDLLAELPVAKDKTCPQTGIERREMNACIRGLVDSLPEQYRTILLLSEVEEFADKEIGEILGLSLATVKMRLHRAKEQLRAKIHKNCRISRDGRNELVCDPKRPAGTPP